MRNEPYSFRTKRLVRHNDASVDTCCTTKHNSPNTKRQAERNDASVVQRNKIRSTQTDLRLMTLVLQRNLTRSTHNVMLYVMMCRLSLARLSAELRRHTRSENTMRILTITVQRNKTRSAQSVRFDVSVGADCATKNKSFST